MSKRKQQVIRYGSNKRSSISKGTGIEYFDSIPDELVCNILSRLPRKSIAQLRRVSMHWSSIIRRPNYDLLFPNKSLASPLLLFAFDVAEVLFFKSLPQPQKSDTNTSLVTTGHHANVVLDLYRLSRPVCGLVCRQDVGKNCSAAVVFNPITGDSLTLPEPRLDGVKSERKREVRYSLGYDPIHKQLKVLHITWLRCGSYQWSGEYQVLTLGTPYLSWRKIECATLHYPLEDNGICINGVLYYPAKLDSNGKHTMVCFDVRSMEFSFINICEDMEEIVSEPCFTFGLIDYKGKLGAYYCDINHGLFELWVLKDAKKHIWTKHGKVMPDLHTMA